MKSAALLPTPGDPFLARYWVRNYERVWKGEVDELIVVVNGGTEDAREAYRNTGARVISVPYRMGHGQALTALTNVTDADVVVFVEDDAFVREPGAIREHLERAAKGEVIGSPRGGMHPILEQAAREKWGDVVSPDGSTGHGLWPCFLFVRTDVLRETDRSFEAQWWWPGDTVPGLGYKVTDTPVDTDTMTSVAFQLRAKHPISVVPQYKEVHQKTFPGSAPWFHAGGLSTLDEPIPTGLSGTNAGRDYAHRLWWWLRTGNEDRRASVMAKAHRSGLVDDLRAWQATEPAWINWQDAA